MRTRGVLSDSPVGKSDEAVSANLGMWPPLEGGPSEPVPQAIASLPRAQELGTYEVLVVEDDPAQRDLLSKLFDAANTKNLGVVTFNVEMVDCGRAALETTRVDGSRFQLILLDLVLPDIAGQEVRRPADWLSTSCLPGLSDRQIHVLLTHTSPDRRPPPHSCCPSCASMWERTRRSSSRVPTRR